MSEVSSKPLVLVTGSSSGIGAGIAKRFAAGGYHALVTFHSSQLAAEEVVEAIQASGGTAESHHLDVTDQESVAGLVEVINETWGRLDVVISNAAVEIAKPVDQASLEEWHTVLLTKLDGAFLITKFTIPLLEKSDNPNLIYITSLSGERPQGDFLAYEVGTAGLIAMTKANAVYLAREFGIRVNAVSPGPVRTPLWDPLPGTTEDMWQRFAESTPLGRIATVDDVAEGCFYLANDPRQFLNGVFLRIDGGKQWA